MLRESKASSLRTARGKRGLHGKPGKKAEVQVSPTKGNILFHNDVIIILVRYVYLCHNDVIIILVRYVYLCHNDVIIILVRYVYHSWP